MIRILAQRLWCDTRVKIMKTLRDAFFLPSTQGKQEESAWLELYIELRKLVFVIVRSGLVTAR